MGKLILTLKKMAAAASVKPGETKDVPSFCSRLEIGLRWDTGGQGGVDLDSSVLLFKDGNSFDHEGDNYPDRDDFDYVAYNHREAKHNGKVCIQHQGDSTTGGGDGEADDEAIRFWLDRLPNDGVAVVVVTMYTEGKTMADLEAIDVRFRTFKDQEEQCCGLGKCCSPNFYKRCLTCPSLPCGSCCGTCVSWPMSKIGQCTGASSFFKSPFKTPPEVNTGMVAVRVHHSGGSWKISGISRFYNESSSGKRYKRGSDLINEAQEFL